MRYLGLVFGLVLWAAALNLADPGETGTSRLNEKGKRFLPCKSFSFPFNIALAPRSVLIPFERTNLVKFVAMNTERQKL